MAAAKPTIESRLQEMEHDLIELLHCCNRDHQYTEAGKLQVMLIQLGTVDIQCASIAAWPPKVKIDESGESHWEGWG